MRPPRRLLRLVATAVVGLCAPAAATVPAVAARSRAISSVERLAAGLDGGSGSTVGPDGALYVTEGAAGRVSRVDTRTGRITTYAGGLPRSIAGVGGAMDVAFLSGTAYVLVTLVGSDVGGSDVVGVYRVDGPHRFTVVADIGAWASAHPPVPPFFLPTGLQYAIEPYGGGFLVTDGHHNRVLRVQLNGSVTEVIAFGNVVPTGLATRGHTVYLAEAGPVPHLRHTGRIISFDPKPPVEREVATGGRLLVDVETGRGGTLYALAQGIWPVGSPEGSPALPNTGQLLRVNRHGSLSVVTGHLNQPTSLELIGNTAYVVTLGGEIWKARSQ
jgi:hypothetical protein